MAFSKAHLFHKDIYRQSFWSKALGHPARIIILTHLLDNGTSPFNVIRKKIPLARETVSQHFHSLREAGLVRAREKFPHTYYSLNKKLCIELAERIKPFQQSFINLKTTGGVNES